MTLILRDYSAPAFAGDLPGTSATYTLYRKLFRSKTYRQRIREDVQSGLIITMHFLQK